MTLKLDVDNLLEILKSNISDVLFINVWNQIDTVYFSDVDVEKKIIRRVLKNELSLEKIKKSSLDVLNTFFQHHLEYFKYTFSEIILNNKIVDNILYLQLKHLLLNKSKFDIDFNPKMVLSTENRLLCEYVSSLITIDENSINEFEEKNKINLDKQYIIDSDDEEMPDDSLNVLHFLKINYSDQYEKDITTKFIDIFNTWNSNKKYDFIKNILKK